MGAIDNPYQASLVTNMAQSPVGHYANATSHISLRKTIVNITSFKTLGMQRHAKTPKTIHGGGVWDDGPSKSLSPYEQNDALILDVSGQSPSRATHVCPTPVFSLHKSTIFHNIPQYSTIFRNIPQYSTIHEHIPSGYD